MDYKLRPESDRKFSTEEDVYYKHDSGAEQLMFEFKWDGKPYEHYWQASGWSIGVVRTKDRRIMVDIGHINEYGRTDWDDTYPVGEFLDCAKRSVNVRTGIPIREDDFDHGMWRFYFDTIIKYADEHLVEAGGKAAGKKK